MANEIENVYASVLDHLQSSLTGANVKIPGVDLNTDDLSEWYEVHVDGPVSAPTRAAQRNEAYILTVNCFADTGFTEGGSQKQDARHHLYLADLVRAQLDAFDLPVEDYIGTAGPSSEVLTQYALSNADNDAALSSSIVGRGVSFRAPSRARYARGVAFNLSRLGTPPGTGIAYLRGHTGDFGVDGVPDASNHAESAAVTLSTLPTSATRTELTFATPFRLVPAQLYTVTFEIDTAGDASNNVRVGVDATLPHTHNGNGSQLTASWADTTTPPGFELIGANIGTLRCEEVNVRVVNDAQRTNIQQAAVSATGLLIV